MKFLVTAILFLLYGCITPQRSNMELKPPVKQVEFKDLDLNEDGDVSVSEVKKFNEMSSYSANVVETKSPVIITVCILLATLLMCLLSAIIKCKKSE